MRTYAAMSGSKKCIVEGMVSSSFAHLPARPKMFMKCAPKDSSPWSYMDSVDEWRDMRLCSIAGPTGRKRCCHTRTSSLALEAPLESSCISTSRVRKKFTPPLEASGAQASSARTHRMPKHARKPSNRWAAIRILSCVNSNGKSEQSESYNSFRKTCRVNNSTEERTSRLAA